MPWNIKIWTLYGGFVALMIFMVVLAFNQNFDMVATDYYALELKYQDKIDKINNTKAIRDQFSFKVNGDNILMQIPEKSEGNFGKVIFFKPSDAKSDREFDITEMSGENLNLNINELSSGKYKITVDWKNNNDEYIIEEIVMIP